MKIRSCLILYFFSNLCSSFALFEDQIGRFDWRQRYVGKVKFAHVDTGGQQIIVATENNVFASISLKTGAIEWRHIFEKGQAGNINAINSNGELMSVNGNGLFLRNWEQKTGIMNWELSLNNFEAVEERLTRFYISPGKNEIFAVQIRPRTSVQATVYSISEAMAKTSPQISAPWIQESTSCAFASSSYFVCIVQSSKTLQLLYLNSGVSFVAVPLKFLGLQTSIMSSQLKVKSLPHQDSSTQPMFSVNLGNDGMLLGKVEASGVKVIKVLPNAVDISTCIFSGKLMVIAILKIEQHYKTVVFDPESGSEIQELGGTFTLSEDHGAIENFLVLPYLRKDNSVSYKILLNTEDSAISLFHQQGKLLWTREEALASIIATEMLELPLSETDAKIEEEFGLVDANALSMLLTRLTTQLGQMQSFFLKTLAGLQDHQNRELLSTNNLVRDKFGLHKVIVAATQSGKVFGIDSLDGQIIWKKLIPNLSTMGSSQSPLYFLFVQRTTAHFPYQPVCTILGKQKGLEESYIHSFNPITGSDVGSSKLPFRSSQAVMLIDVDSTYMKGIIIMDSNKMVHLYPAEYEETFLKLKGSYYVMLADPALGTVTGYSFALSLPGALKATEVWRISLPLDQQIITQVHLKKTNEHVHSQGRVMGDRSVLYKYLNPNLAVIVTEGMDPVNKYLLNVYLVDAVTGLLLYASSHKRSRGPVHVVHSENWIVYSLYNEKSRRVELSSIELYEGKSQSNTTAFSSLSPPALPLVEHQNFIFPAGIEAMTQTLTEKGITNKHILIALPLGGIVELPKAFVDPRRPVHPQPEHREEGLIPYLPELPVASEGIINYNQSAYNIRSIYTAPTGLESTCLVFAYGLDLFFTRVTPSKTFDILKDDFDHLLISAVLIALMLFSYGTRRLASRKALRTAWK